MGKVEATEAVARLVANYGMENISEDRVNSYVDNLCDVDPALLSEAVRETIRKQKFFPAVSELRETAARLSGMLPALPAEALSIIRQADKTIQRRHSDGSFSHDEKVWDWPPMNKATREAVEEALSKSGEPCDEDGKPHFGWEMGFQKVYEVEAQVVTTRALADLSLARLPAPKPQIALPKPEPVKFQPDPNDKPIPTCVRCKKHMAFFDTPDGPICGFCQRFQNFDASLPGGDRE